MNKKVTELTETSEINSEDLLMVIQDGENKKAKAGTILNKVNENAEKIESHYIPTNIQEEQGWYLALSGNVVGHNNNAFILSIQQITNGGAGQLYANIRCWNENTLDLREFKWLSNTGLNSSDFKLKLDGNNYYLYMRTSEAYGQYQIKVVQSSDTPVTAGNMEDILTFYTPLANDTVEEPDGISPSFKNQKVLWRDAGGSFMHSNQTAPLSEKISEQKNGIILLFQPYRNNEPQPFGLYSYFFPKHLIELFGDGFGYSITIPDNDFGIQAGKYIYFYDDYLQGNDANTSVATMFGTSVDSKNVVLTAVIGV